MSSLNFFFNYQRKIAKIIFYLDDIVMNFESLLDIERTFKQKHTGSKQENLSEPEGCCDTEHFLWL